MRLTIRCELREGLPLYHDGDARPGTAYNAMIPRVDDVSLTFNALMVDGDTVACYDESLQRWRLRSVRGLPAAWRGLGFSNLSIATEKA